MLLHRHALLSLIGAVLIGSAPIGTPHAAEPAGCEIHWQVTPHLDATPRHLAVTMRFDAGARQRSELRLPDEWAGVDDYTAQLTELTADRPEHRIEPVAGKPALRTIRHAPGDRVVLRFKVGTTVADPDSSQQTHLDAYRALLGKDWFQFFGHGVLPTLSERDDSSRTAMCVTIDGLPADSVIATSHGVARGPEALLRFSGGPDLARHAVYLGGRLQLRERTVEGQPLAVVLPPSVPWAFGADALADAVAQLVGTQRRFWRDTDFPFLLVALHANHRPSGSNGGTAVHQAFAMHASDDLRVPGATFEHLVGHEHLHTWIPMRTCSDASLLRWRTTPMENCLLSCFFSAIREPKRNLSSPLEIKLAPIPPSDSLCKVSFNVEGSNSSGSPELGNAASSFLVTVFCGCRYTAAYKLAPWLSAGVRDCLSFWMREMMFCKPSTTI
ncbi:MAG: hypothetical protein HY021_01810 [Burkholderiales bacterium]|nr:hypothetical protein [Burkholderiales bacterium]